MASGLGPYRDGLHDAQYGNGNMNHHYPESADWREYERGYAETRLAITRTIAAAFCAQVEPHYLPPGAADMFTSLQKVLLK